MRRPALEIPASSGVHGPGEMIRCDGFHASISSTRDLIVALDPQLDRRIDLAQSLDQVVGEGIVVIDEEDHVRYSQAAVKARSCRGAAPVLLDRNVRMTRPEEKPRRIFAPVAPS